MSNNSQWKSALQTLIDQNNHRHASRPKGVLHKTVDERASALFRWFKLLRALGIDCAPKNLNGRHIQLLMDYWTCHSAVADLCRERGITMRDRPYSAAYIQQQLSFLRVFSRWIGKPGMVLTPERYVDDASLVSRHLRNGC